MRRIVDVYARHTRMTVEYAEMVEGDVEDVVALAAATFPNRTEAAAFRVVMRVPNAWEVYPSWVARDGGVLVGYGFGQPLPSDDGSYLSGTTFNLHQLAVAEPYRGQGVGGELLRRIVDSAAKVDYRHIVAKITASSVEMYRSRGWEMAEAGGGLAWVERSIDARTPLKKRGRRTTTFTLTLRPEAEYPIVGRLPIDDSVIFHAWGEPSRSPFGALATALSTRPTPGWLSETEKQAIRRVAR